MKTKSKNAVIAAHEIRAGIARRLSILDQYSDITCEPEIPRRDDLGVRLCHCFAICDHAIYYATVSSCAALDVTVFPPVFVTCSSILVATMTTATVCGTTAPIEKIP